MKKTALVVLLVLLLSTASSAWAAELIWTGTWDTNWGTMKLTQQDNEVTGSYVLNDNDNSDNGVIKGIVDGNTLKGTWSDELGKGEFEFKLMPDKRSFKGYYNTDAGPNGWDGTKIQ
jgi:uncharacterized protein (DUF2147 family)